MTYPMGYDSHLVSGYSHRTAEKEGRFLLPHLKPNMSLLDCGCGPGSITAGFARCVSRVVAMDIESSQLNLAKHAIQGDHASFVEGSILDIPFEDNTFDVVFAHALLCHLKTPLKAFDELQRVVKPGGIVAVRDVDLDTAFIYPEHEVLSRGEKVFRRALDLIGGDYTIGRKYRWLMNEVGLTDVSISSSSETYATREDLATFIPIHIRKWEKSEWSKLIREEKWISEEEFSDILLAYRKLINDPRTIMSRVFHEAIGIKA